MNSLEEKILDEFNAIKPSLIAWGEFVDGTLIKDVFPEMISDHLVKILPECRLKDDKSFLYKALYRKKPYTKPIVDIEDKIGTRVVVLKSDDIKIIQQKILSFPMWNAKLTKDMNQEIEDQPKIFDYQSAHIVVSPKENDEKFQPDLVPLLTCEIQIRTLLQHAFAEVSHDSTYKGPYKNDKDILRRLAKAMALMEATDDYFCNIFSLMSDEKRHYANYLKELTGFYKQFNPDFNHRELNQFVTDSIFDLLELCDVPISELEIFVTKYKIELGKLILSKNGLLFQQPIIILILFYFINKRTFLKDNWPLQIESLKSIYKITGTSYDSF